MTEKCKLFENYRSIPTRVKKILIINTKIKYKNNNKNYLQILEVTTIRYQKPTLNKIAFNTSINIFNN